MKRASTGYWVAIATIVLKISSITAVSQVLKWFKFSPQRERGRDAA
jgi:hypothetical protein